MADRKIIHGAMVDDTGAESVSNSQIKSFINKAGKGLATVYFTDKWAISKIKFPADKAIICKNNGSVPFVRLQNSDDPDGSSGSPGKYSHKKVLDGKWDTQLKQYASDIHIFGYPVIVEYGTEINGDWFDWSLEGPDLFKKAYRYIYKLFTGQGFGQNVKFAFHCDATDNNNSHKWYPGDDIISIVGTSCYGGYGSGKGCIDTMDTIYSSFANDISKTADLAIFEWGAPEPKNIAFNVQDTIKTLKELPLKYPRIIMLQRWCERIISGHSEDKIGDGRIDVTPEMLKAYQQGISNPDYVDTY